MQRLTARRPGRATARVDSGVGFLAGTDEAAIIMVELTLGSPLHDYLKSLLTKTNGLQVVRPIAVPERVE